MRITFVIGSLQGGGAERVASLLVNAWTRKGHEVTLLTLEPEDAASSYAVDPGVRLRRLGLIRPCASRLGALALVARSVFSLRKAIKASHPDAVISFIDEINVRTVLACTGLKVPVVISERVHPGHYSISWFWNSLRRLTYGYAMALVVQTREIAQWCAERYGTIIHVIPNPVPAPEVRASGLQGERRLVVGAGRLMSQKGFDLLIRAFSALADEYPEWDLVIYGEGEEREVLEELSRGLGLAGRVSLPGWKRDLAGEFAKADVLCLSSRFEGFPNVLCEAMSVGLPVVATRCPGGPQDIVTHERDGLLVGTESVSELELGLRRVMGDAALRRRLGECGLLIPERFGLDRVADMWIECVLDDPR